METVISELKGLAYIAIAFAWIYLAKWLQDHNVKARFNADEEIEEKSNLAVALRRGGLYLCVSIALFGAIAGPSQGFVKDLILLMTDGIFITIALAIAKVVSEKIILPHLDNNEEIRKGNVAVGLSEMGLFLATGLIAAGSFTGSSPSLLQGILSALVFFILGQAILVIGAKLIGKTVKFDLAKEMQEGNSAAGIFAGGILLALGVVLAQSIAGDSMGWVPDLTSFGISAVKAILALFIFTWLADLIFLPNTTVAEEVARDKNNAAMVVTMSVVVAVATLVIAAT